MLAAGSVLQGRYQIEEILGQGGMGAVYLATEKHLGGKKVAIKEMAMLIQNPADRERALEQFHAEAQILASLDHPGLVDVTHYFEENGKQYLVMAYAAGKTFEQRLNATPYFLPEAEVLDWFEQVADVLIYLHRHKPPIIFRDMKPSNVMVDEAGRVRLIDFGIARSFDHGSKTSTFIKGAGTAGFAPLEQYGHEGTTDPRTDVYAFGATLYTMMTRTIPRASVDLAGSDEALTPPRSINPAISPRLEAVILTMMALKKNDRYQTMEAARQALRLVRTALAAASEVSPAVTMRFCTNCGATASANNQWCNRCGTSLDGPKSTATAPPPFSVSASTAVKAGSPLANLQPDVPGESPPTLYRGDSPPDAEPAPPADLPAEASAPDTIKDTSQPSPSSPRRRRGALVAVGLALGVCLIWIGLNPDILHGFLPDPTISASATSSASASPSDLPTASRAAEVPSSAPSPAPSHVVSSPSPLAVPEISMSASPAPLATPSAEPSARASGVTSSEVKPSGEAASPTTPEGSPSLSFGKRLKDLVRGHSGEPSGASPMPAAPPSVLPSASVEASAAATQFGSP